MHFIKVHAYIFHDGESFLFALDGAKNYAVKKLFASGVPSREKKLTECLS